MELDQEFYLRKSEQLKVLAHPVRLCIVRGLMTKESCNVTYMHECLHCSQSSISQHLAKLKAAGLVKASRSGNQIYYQLADEQIKKVINALFSE